LNNHLEGSIRSILRRRRRGQKRLILCAFETSVTFTMFQRSHILNFYTVFGTALELESFIRVVTPSAEVTFSPRYRHLYATSTTKTTALRILRRMRISIHTLHKLLNLDLFFFVVLFEHF